MATVSYTEALATLQTMFEDLDQETISIVLDSNGGNMEQTVDQLLSMSGTTTDTPAAAMRSPGDLAPSSSHLDSNFLRAPGTDYTSTSAEQLAEDEMLAQMLQDEMFLQEVQRNPEFRQTFGSPERSRASSGIGSPTPPEKKRMSTASKLSNLTGAAKKKLMVLAAKFNKKGNAKSAARTVQYSSLLTDETDSGPRGNLDNDDVGLHRRGAPPRPDAYNQDSPAADRFANFASYTDPSEPVHSEDVHSSWNSSDAQDDDRYPTAGRRY
eukprot:GILJ01003828.1.p1 GENE.GILJ01003828.1~~GILJ01003828.1.p1  ORF type:complete len:284 (+),score=62.10 GILJ01003828.1:49-852(+)